MKNIITIVGRPNVGKSTLFNRLIKQNKAITKNISGTTRNLNYGYSEWLNKKFIVIDTGGYIYNPNDILEKYIHKQIKISINQANVILLMVEYQNGLTALDNVFFNILKKSNKNIILVVNKIDKPKIKCTEFEKIGIEKIFYISSNNGSGIAEMLNEITKYFKKNIKNEEKNIPKICIIGKPNVGKSSFLNLIIKKERSIVTNIPGTTREPIDSHYNLNNKKFIIIDTAGIKKKSKIKNSIELYSIIKTIKIIKKSNICIIMIDAKENIQSQDINIISLTQKYKKGLIIVINKWDLIKKNKKTTLEYKKKILEKISPIDYIPIIFISVIKKQKIYEVTEKILEIYKNKIKKISNLKINKIINKSIEKYSHPTIGGKNVKIKYIKQIEKNIPTFEFSCNFPKSINEAYKRYLKNQIRKNFKFEGIPINIIFKIN